MKLSPKAVRFVIDALVHYRKFHDEQLGLPILSEDKIAEIENDQMFLDAIRMDFEKHLDEMTRERQTVNVDV